MCWRHQVDDDYQEIDVGGIFLCIMYIQKVVDVCD